MLSAPLTNYIAYNDLYFWQTSFSDLLGTLVHECGHFVVRSQYPNGSDSAIENALGGNAKDTTAVDKKLAKDCFNGVKE